MRFLDTAFWDDGAIGISISKDGKDYSFYHGITSFAMLEVGEKHTFDSEQKFKDKVIEITGRNWESLVAAARIPYGG